MSASHHPNLQTDRCKGLRQAAPIVLHIECRDTGKRLASCAIMLATLLWLGFEAQAFLLLAMTLPYEPLLLYLARSTPSEPRQITPLRSVVVMVSVCFVSGAYLLPAIALASHPSIPVIAISFMWVYGVTIHMANTYASVAIYFRYLLIPAVIYAELVLYSAARSDHPLNDPVHWAVAMGLMMVYFGNIFESMSRQKDTHSALALAREKADTRLAELEHMTRHDALTGLLTRPAFDAELATRLSKSEDGGRYAVFLVDLDGFKPINDTYSHDAGDTVLRAVADRLRHTAKEIGIAARLGGDEFAIAMPGIASPWAARDMARDIRGLLLRPVDFEEKRIRVGASVGVALAKSRHDEVKTLCSGADQAMYRAKTGDGDGTMFYDPILFAPRLSLEDKDVLRNAMKDGEIVPHYQPKVALGSGRIIGFEALARWEKPGETLVMPGDFIPRINELGLHSDFAYSMTARVLEDLERLRAHGLDPGQVSINVPEITLATHSGRQDLEWLLSEHPDCTENLTFEITEDVFIARSGGIIQDSIARLAEQGVRISLDDFGTGFASFQHLRQLRFHEMKIDTSFVADLGTDPVAEVIVRGFISIAQGLGVVVVAEGVETEDQARDLIAMGCEFAQGFYFGAAEPWEDMRDRLFSEEARPARRA